MSSTTFEAVPSQTKSLRLENNLSKSRSPYVSVVSIPEYVIDALYVTYDQVQVRSHMKNPVAWQIWDTETLSKAKEADRLIFVSIGYSACHWCHVMERESFEDQAIATILNQHFIPIKIDREERPDIDRIYMNYVQATTRRGGWPLNVFLTPDLEPIFGGTYFPGPDSKSTSLGQLDFSTVLQRMRLVWHEQRQQCVLEARSITVQLKEYAQEGSFGAQRLSLEDGDRLDLDILEEAYSHFEAKYDLAHGGFGGAPKFPTPINLTFLLLLSQLQGPVKDVVGPVECENAKAMALHTLRQMTRGGIHDQIGHGFARYSVTKDWNMPHFEKMLYDQSQLLSAYLDAFLLSGDVEMLGAVYDIAGYLTEPPIAAAGGGFYSSEDADSFPHKDNAKKSEGAFYVWTKDEVENVIGKSASQICGSFWNIKKGGNINPEHDVHQELAGMNVLAVSSTPEQLSQEFGIPREEVVRIIKDARTTLLYHRNMNRPRPDLDDKIVAGWNGLAIGALARASSVLQSIPGAEKAAECLGSAMKAVKFIEQHLLDTSTFQLYRIYRNGRGESAAFSDDYCFCIQGLIELYEATFDDQYLELADNLQRTQNNLFWDSLRGGFFATQVDQADVLMRLKEGMDSAEPSTNGISASNLYRLGSLLDDPEYTSMGTRTCEAFAPEISQNPFLFSSMMPAVVAGQLGMRSVVICGNGDEVESAIATSRLRLKPNTTVARLGAGVRSEWLKSRNKLLQSFSSEKSVVQVCEGGTCREVLDMSEMEKALGREFD